ncbi:MAG: flagellar hook-basal body complex protein [Peptococcaceae bacterium]|nr:flagellar hook-basal body complex protein [Peptococcaceae bacterium]
MIRGIYTAASGLGTLQARMDITSNNLSNIASTGFKQDKPTVGAFPDFLLKQKMKTDVGGVNLGWWQTLGSTNQGVALTGVFTDFSTGVLKNTDNELDLALDGEGFFAFEDEDGNILYSRDGQLGKDGEGYLLNSKGHKILAEGSPVLVGKGSFSVNPQGILTTEDGTETKLDIYDFQNRNALVKQGNNYYNAGEEEGILMDNPNVRQNALELANVDVAAETVNMIEITRAYEAAQKMVQAQDQLLDKVINQVGVVR